MATSNDITWELDRNAMIEAVYRKLGIPGEGNVLTSTQYADGATALNGVIALAVTKGMPLWKRTQVSLTPSVSSQSYTLTGALKVAQVALRDASGVQYLLQPKSQNDMLSLPYGTAGVPVNWSFTPTISGGTLTFYPTLSDAGTASSKTFQVLYQRKFDGFDTTTTDTPDFPSYWSLPLIYKTAVILAPENGIPLEDRKQLMLEAAMFWKEAEDFGDDVGSVYFQPEQRF